MKILNLYVTKNFLITLVVANFIVVFGLMGAQMLKIFEAISRGVPVSDALYALAHFMPMSLAITIPVGMLVATMLVFGRLSADNEITAMRACGISILQIISPLMILAFILSCTCLYLQLVMGPVYTDRGKSILKSIAVTRPLSIIEPGAWIQYQDNNIFIGNTYRDNTIRDIQIFKFGKRDTRPKQDITAASGRIVLDEEAQIMKIELFDASIVQYEENRDQPHRTFTEKFELALDYGKQANDIRVAKSIGSLTYKEIFGRIIMFRKRGLPTTQLELLLNQRLAFGLAPIAFLLIGMPLSIKTSRKETSIGLVISVGLAGVYFISIMIFDAFYMYPRWHPQILLWIPNIAYQIGGAFFIWKISMR